MAQPPPSPTFDDVVIARAVRHAQALRKSHQTYGGHLRAMSQGNLLDLSIPQTVFLTDHANLLSIVRQAQEEANIANDSTATYTLIRAELGIRYIQNRTGLIMVMSTGDIHTAAKTQEGINMYRESISMRTLIESEFVNLLMEWDRIPAHHGETAFTEYPLQYLNYRHLMKGMRILVHEDPENGWQFHEANRKGL